MRPIVRFLSVVSTLAALSFALAACSSDDGALYADYPPPSEAGGYEIAPLIQNPETEIWRPGYWTLVQGEGFEWVPGEVMMRPTPTAVWASARWVKHTYGWTFEQGHWE